MVLPDKYIEAAGQNEQYEEAGLSKRFIQNTALKLLGKTDLLAGPTRIAVDTGPVAGNA